MQDRNPMDEAARNAGAAREDLNRARRDATDAAEHVRDAARHGTEAMQAGASGLMERAGTASGGVAGRTDFTGGGASGKGGNIADRAKHAAGDALHDATDAVSEKAAQAANRISDEASALRAAAGEKLETVRGPLMGSALGALVGVLAGALGGWWAGRAMSSGAHELPEEHEEACRVHFVSYTMRPANVTYDDARPGYLLGYMASQNPDYTGRSYDDVENDLRRGFTDDYAARYDSLRDYARYGYERGSTLR